MGPSGDNSMTTIRSMLLTLAATTALSSTAKAQGQTKASSRQSDSAVVADFEERFSAATARLARQVWVEQLGPDWHYELYRGKWLKHYCELGEFSFDVERTQSLVSPLVATAEGQSQQVIL